MQKGKVKANSDYCQGGWWAGTSQSISKGRLFLVLLPRAEAGAIQASGPALQLGTHPRGGRSLLISHWKEGSLLEALGES